MTRLASRALVQAVTDYLGVLDMQESKSRDWASATFVGTHHDLAFSLADQGAAACKLVALPDVELPMAGHFVADLRLVSVEAREGRLRAVIEVLTIEDH